MTSAWFEYKVSPSLILLLTEQRLNFSVRRSPLQQDFLNKVGHFDFTMDHVN